MRLRLLTLAACFATIHLAVADNASPNTRKPTNIPAEPLGVALQTLAKERGFQVVYVSDDVRSHRTPGASGDLTIDEALRELLRGTGLTYRHIAGNGVSIAPLANPPASPPSGAATSGSENESASAGADTSESEAAIGTEAVQLATIVVTAEKRTELERDVPLSMSVLSGDNLVRSQSYNFEDYAGKVPGLMVADDGPVSELSIRGITTGGGNVNGYVASYIDETPYTSEGSFALSAAISPNLDTYDMQRIEVLRGPQGTLYGANALGGLIKFVTNAPDPSAFAVSTEVGGNSIDHGGLGYNVHAMVNLPLSDDTAVRLVGYDTHYAGFIDDPSRDLTDINGSRVTGGRASILYAPTSAFSIRATALYQRLSLENPPSEEVTPTTLQPIYGDLTAERLINETSSATTQLYNVTAKWDLGFANLLSSTSYSNFQVSELDDASAEYGAFTTLLLGAPYGIAATLDEQIRSATQEIRLSSEGAGKLGWQVGAYFTNQHADAPGGGATDGLFPIGIASRSVLYGFPLSLGELNVTPSYKEFASFADLDYHLTHSLDIGLGGRYSHNDQSTGYESSGALYGTENYLVNSSEGVFTYSGDIRWYLSSQSMLYGRVATGYAPGGPNSDPPGSDVPRSYKSSTDTNYEVGIKNSLLHGSLVAEVALFDIEWRDIQLDQILNNLSAITNSEAARSQGAEWNLVYIPVNGLTLTVNGAYTDARLTAPPPPGVGGHDGSPLPNAPRWSGYAGVDYKRPITDALSAFGGVDWRFTGTRYADLSTIGPRQQMPSFGIVDLRAGVEKPNWSLTLYAKNVTDRRAIDYVGPETLAGGLGPQLAFVYVPRNIGVEFSTTF